MPKRNAALMSGYGERNRTDPERRTRGAGGGGRAPQKPRPGVNYGGGIVFRNRRPAWKSGREDTIHNTAPHQAFAGIEFYECTKCSKYAPRKGDHPAYLSNQVACDAAATAAGKVLVDSWSTVEHRTRWTTYCQDHVDPVEITMPDGFRWRCYRQLDMDKFYNKKENLCILCNACNARKGQKDKKQTILGLFDPVFVR